DTHRSVPRTHDAGDGGRSVGLLVVGHDANAVVQFPSKVAARLILGHYALGQEHLERLICVFRYHARFVFGHLTHLAHRTSGPRFVASSPALRWSRGGVPRRFQASSTNWPTPSSTNSDHPRGCRHFRGRLTEGLLSRLLAHDPAGNLADPVLDPPPVSAALVHG